MEVLFGVSHPFKIGYMIISLVTIYMIYREFVLRIRNKHESNKAMDFKVLFTVMPETHYMIAIRI